MRKKRTSRDDAPELTGRELKHAKGMWRIGGKPVTPAQGKAAFAAALTRKTRVNMHLDNDVIAYFKQAAGTRGYQTLINAALRQQMTQGSELPASNNAEINAMRAEIRALHEEFGVLHRAVANLNTSTQTGLTGSFVVGGISEHEQSNVSMTHANSTQPSINLLTQTQGHA